MSVRIMTTNDTASYRLPDTMSGVVLVAHGGPDCLEWRDDLPVAPPGPGDVVIRVAAAGVNNTDINTRVGWYSKSGADADVADGVAADAGWGGNALQLPRVQGIDVCGHVVAVGDGVDAKRLGERVLVEPCLVEADGADLDSPWFLGSECDGGFAEYVRVAARHAHRIDSTMSDVELASFPCSYSTAENMLVRAGVTAGDTVLITGASGGVGSAAVQLVTARGATAIAVASPGNAHALLDLGATEVVERDADLVEALGANSIEVVIDLVAGPGWPALLDVLRPRGRYAVAGAVAGPIVELDVRTLYLKDLSFFGCTALGPGVFASLVSTIERAAIRPLVAASFPLAEIAAAQGAFAAKGFIGKVVLTVAATD